MATFTFNYEAIDSNSVLQSWRQLIDRAKEAASVAYSPYSHFSVGAAVLTSGQHIDVGSNQENAAYPSGLCAERTAVFHANALYPDEAVVRLVIVARNGGVFTPSPITPCGSCRQVLLETERRYKQNIEILLYGEQKSFIIHSAADLMPLSFSSDSLNA